MSEVKFRRIGIPEQGRGFLLVCAGQRLVLQLAARLTVESWSTAIVDDWSRAISSASLGKMVEMSGLLDVTGEYVGALM